MSSGQGGGEGRPPSPGQQGGLGRPLSLHPTTLAGAGPLEAAAAAARAGFRMVDVRLDPAYPGDPSPSLLDGVELRRALKRGLAADGVEVLTAEVLRLRPELEAQAFERHLEVAAELGARFVLTVSHDPVAERAAARLAGLGALAAARGLRIVLEFMTFSAARSALDAAEVVARAGHPAVGILADALHLARSGGAARDLRGLPVWVGQLCDAPARAPADLAGEARGARLVPGEGELPLRDFIAALDPSVPLSVEATSSVPEDWDARAARARRAALALLG